MKSYPFGYILFFWVSVIIACFGCNSGGREKGLNDSLAIRKSIAEAPALSPEASIKKMHIENGFAVKLVAAEPLIAAPVAMSFDNQGRIWAIEMLDYMPDTLGTGEGNRSGKVVILSDKNGDGLMDDRRVFLDSLVLPRAICLIENGVLVAEPPNLWYYTIENDRPGQRTLVDSTYATGGNVEHQPNGLLRALDNWIYNAKSDKRYRKKGDQWLIERTHFRGQWGITQDDYGRLFYNHNSANILGDYFAPSFGAANKHQKAIAGFNEVIVANNRVYPVRPTPGINRGYMAGMLDDSLRLVNFTAAAGPVIYSGALFGKDYAGNAFVPEPSANLIKRNILYQTGYKAEGKQAFEGKEFLASEDERFRPVNLFNGPDGALYIVDMYRGIIQHKTYLTAYLKNEIKERNLTQPLTYGRIYKIVPAGKNPSRVTLTDNPDNLLPLLEHPNGWVRNKAQQMIIDGKYTQLEPALRKLLDQREKPLSVTHAMWTLEGLTLLQWEDVALLLEDTNPALRQQALSALPSLVNQKNVEQVAGALKGLMKDSLVAPYLAFLTTSIRPYSTASANELMHSLIRHYKENNYVADAVISNLQGKETAYSRSVLTLLPDTTLAIHRRLKKVLEDIAATKKFRTIGEPEKKYARGYAVFQTVCATCHGKDGAGIASLAPPLNGSEWVTGDKNKLTAIVLFGMTGPVRVGDKLYKAPEINGDMPAIGQSHEFSDEDIAQVLNYIRNAWNNKGTPVYPGDIHNIRNKYKGRRNPFTAEELNSIRSSNR